MSDEEQIRGLFARYAHLTDSGELEARTQLFVENGTFKPGNGEPFTGHEAMLAGTTSRHARNPERRTKHVCCNSLIEVNGDEATAVSDYFVFIRSGAGEAWSATTSGKHHDRLVRINGQWLFAERINVGDS